MLGWWIKDSKVNSKSNIEMKELDKVDEEEEMEVLVSSTSPLIEEADMDTCEDEMPHRRSSKACHCSICLNTLIENLPKPPCSTTNIIKSQSLTNILYNQTESNVLHSYPKVIIQTREQETGKLVSYSPEILNFQGHQHSQEEIAPMWKKDCRMWLWKSFTATCKRRKLNM